MSCCEQSTAHLQRALIEVQFVLGDLGRLVGGQSSSPAPCDYRAEDLHTLLLARRLLESVLKPQALQSCGGMSAEAAA